MFSKRILLLAVALLSGIVTGAYFFSRGKPISVALPNIGKQQPVTFYRWKDESGALQMSSERPPAGVPFEVTTVDGTLTTMDGPKPPEETDDSSVNPLSVYSPGGMEKLLKDSKNNAAALREAQEQQRRLIETQQ